jgi:DNA-binding transcriptional LysR family regulator
MIDVRRLAVLRELHRCGTVTAAAAALSLTPSAVSQQLAALARQTGVRLVESHGRRLRLTGPGLVLVQHAEAVLAELEHAETAMRALAGGDTGVVTVGAFATAINGLVIPAMRALRQRNDGISVNVRDMEGDAALDALMAGEIDIALWLAWPGSRGVEERGAVGRPLLDDVLDVALPSGHPCATERRVPLAALRDESWVAGLPGSPCRRIYEAACAGAGFTPRVEHCSDDWTAVVGLVGAGAGVALVPRLAQPAVTADVVVRPVAGAVPHRSLSLVTRPAAAAAAHVTAVVEELVSAAAAVPDRVGGARSAAA